MNNQKEITKIYFSRLGETYFFRDMKSDEERAIWKRLLDPELQEIYKMIFLGFGEKHKAVKAFRVIYPKIPQKYAEMFYDDIMMEY